MRLFFAALTLICLANQGIFAQGETIKNYNVEDVVITATRSPLPLKSAPVITRVIHAADIERSGAPTLQGVLERELAGVEFHQAGYGSSLSFQGLDARYVLFLIDGERIAGETYGNVDYSRIPLNSIERIEIVRGASSVLYGSNAMGAVVNIITRMPKERVEVSGSFRYGTPYQSNSDEKLGNPNHTESDLKKYRSKIDLPNTKADLSVGFNLGKFKSLTSASYRTVDAYKVVGSKDERRTYPAYNMQIFKINTTGMGNPIQFLRRVPVDTTIIASPDSRGLSVSGSSDFNISQRFDYVLNDKFRFQISGGYFDKKRYDFNENIMDENPMPNKNKVWSSEALKGYNIKALMEHSPNADNKIYLSFIRDQYLKSVDTLNKLREDKQRHVYNNPRLLWTLNTDYHRLTTGLEMINEQLNFDLNANKNFNDRKILNSGSLYIQDEILTGRPLSFVVGLRGEYSDRFGRSLTPKISAKYNVGDFAIRANYSKGYRTPSLKEMYMEFVIPIPGSSTIIQGNDNLSPETNNYLSLSGEYSIKRLNISATVFRSEFKNKIDVTSRTEGTTTMLQYSNIKESNINGLELTARVIPIDRLIISANYNYVKLDNDAPSGSTQYIYPSPHTATAQIDYSIKIKELVAGVIAGVRYVGAKEYSDFMPIMVVDKTQRPPSMYLIMGSYSSQHDGYATANAAVNIEWRRKIAVTVGMDNIFNYRPSVVNFNSAIMPSRCGFIQMSFNL